jgi:hypothetical protein
MRGKAGGRFVVCRSGDIAMVLFNRSLHRHSVVPEHAGTGGSRPSAFASSAAESRLQRERRIDEELAQSFPASDPPSWVQGASARPS